MAYHIGYLKSIKKQEEVAEKAWGIAANPHSYHGFDDYWKEEQEEQ